MNTSDTIKELAEALATAQGEMESPEKTKEAVIRSAKGNYKYKYADIADVLKCVKPVMSKYGLSHIQGTVLVDGHMVLRTRIMHKSGEFIESDYPVCATDNNHQSMGSAMTYARRYALSSMVGIAAVDDTDAQGAAQSGSGAKKAKSTYQTKKEVDWSKVQDSIDKAPDHDKLDKVAERVEANKGEWSPSYYDQAVQRIAERRAELINAELTVPMTIEEWHGHIVEATDKKQIDDLYTEMVASEREWSEEDRQFAYDEWEKRKAEIESGADLLKAG